MSEDFASPRIRRRSPFPVGGMRSGVGFLQGLDRHLGVAFCVGVDFPRAAMRSEQRAGQPR